MGTVKSTTRAEKAWLESNLRTVDISWPVPEDCELLRGFVKGRLNSLYHQRRQDGFQGFTSQGFGAAVKLVIIPFTPFVVCGLCNYSCVVQ